MPATNATNNFVAPAALSGTLNVVVQTLSKWLKTKLDAIDSQFATQSRHRARVTRATAQAVGTGVVSSIVWTAAEYNSGPWNASVNPQRLTAQFTGTHHIELCALWAPNAAGIRYFAIAKNGAVGSAQWTEQSTEALWYKGSAVSCDIYMAVGDYVEGICYQSSGGNLNVDPTYTLSMSMYWLGA